MTCGSHDKKESTSSFPFSKEKLDTLLSSRLREVRSDMGREQVRKPF